MVEKYGIAEKAELDLRLLTRILKTAAQFAFPPSASFEGETKLMIRINEDQLFLYSQMLPDPLCISSPVFNSDLHLQHFLFVQLSFMLVLEPNHEGWFNSWTTGHRNQCPVRFKGDYPCLIGYLI